MGFGVEFVRFPHFLERVVSTIHQVWIAHFKQAAGKTIEKNYQGLASGMAGSP